MAVTLADAPHLVTERLDLRLPVASDLAASLAIVTAPETRRHLGPQTGAADHFLRFCRSAGSWLLYGYGSFVIRPRGKEEVIGTCGLFHGWRDLGPDFDDNPEAGWILRHDHTGQGLAGEAMEAVLDWFDRAHGRRAVCLIEPGNAPSLRLAARLGFTPLRDAELDGGPVRLLERPAAAR